MSEASGEANIIPGSGGTSDVYNIEGQERPETRPIIPLGHKTYDGEHKPRMGFFTDTTVCIGCGYCVPACPFGVLDQREGDGRVWKCTMCYDRQKDGLGRPGPPRQGRRQRRTGQARLARCPWWGDGQPAPAHLRPGQTRALLQHAQGLKTHLTDERRNLDSLRLRHLDGGRRSERASRHLPQNWTRLRDTLRPAWAGARHLHGRAGRRHLHPRLARGQARVAAPVRLLLGRKRGCRRDHLHAHRARRSGAPVGRRRCLGRDRSRGGDEASPWRLPRGALRRGEGGSYDRLSKACSGAGAAVMALAGRTRRAAAVAGGALVLAGAVLERWSVYRAGFQSARDPKYTVMPQRERGEA